MRKKAARVSTIAASAAQEEGVIFLRARKLTNNKSKKKEKEQKIINQNTKKECAFCRAVKRWHIYLEVAVSAIRITHWMPKTTVVAAGTVQERIISSHTS